MLVTRHFYLNMYMYGMDINCYAGARQGFPVLYTPNGQDFVWESNKYSGWGFFLGGRGY